MRVKPYFSTTVGKEVFKHGIEAEYKDATINFLKNCKLNDGSDAYPMDIIEEPKKKKERIKDIKEPKEIQLEHIKEVLNDSTPEELSV